MKLNKYGCCPSGDVCLEHQSPLITFGMCGDSPELKDFIKEIRQETLREVLPESFGNRSLLDVTPLSDNGWDDCRRTIQQKAKELWGIDLTNIK